MYIKIPKKIYELVKNLIMKEILVRLISFTDIVSVTPIFKKICANDTATANNPVIK